MNIDPKLPYQTLHSHTILSDGELNYRQMLDSCLKYKIGVIAFTDHDILPGRRDLKQLEELRTHRVKYIIGVELESKPPKDVRNQKLRLDIVGLFVNPHDKAIKEYSSQLWEIKGIRNKEKIIFLQDLGFDINIDDIKGIVGHDRIMTPHIVKTLMTKKRNLNLIQKYIKELKAEKNQQPRLQKLWDTMQNESLDQQVFSLFLRSESFIPLKQKEIDKSYKDFDSVVKLIHNAGGIAILAHYTFGPKRLGSEKLEEIFKNKQIDGAEIVYGMSKKDFTPQIVEDMKYINSIVEKNNLLKSGGADIHNEDQMRFFAKNKQLASKTTTFIQKILEIYTPDLGFSSITK